MARRKDYEREDDERARMAAAVRRLEVLLRDPGPAAAATPAEDPPDATLDEPDAQGDGDDPARDDARNSDTADQLETSAKAAPRRRAPRYIWTSKAEAGPLAPPRRPTAIAPPILRPAAAGALNAKRRPPGRLLSWLIALVAGSSNGAVYSSLEPSAGAIRAVLAFSGAIAVATLAWPLSVLVTLDVALPLASTETLTALAIVTVALFVCVGLLDLARRRITARIAAEFEMRLAGRAFEAGLRGGPATAHEAADIFDGWRRFAFGPAPAAALDAIATPFAILAAGLIDWRFGAAAAVAAATLAAVGHYASRGGWRLLQEADSAARRSDLQSPAVNSDCGAVTAMGFVAEVREAWLDACAEALSWRLLAADRFSGATSAASAARWIALAAVLALAGWLALNGDITTGAALAGALLVVAALAPIVRLTAALGDIAAARVSLTRISQLLDQPHRAPVGAGRTLFSGAIEAKSLRVAGHDGRTTLLSGISFKIERGQTLAIEGASGSGKSSLAKTILGLRAPASGELLFDGAPLDATRGDATGRHFGYLPQTFSFHGGSIAEAIARHRPGAQKRDIIAAAKLAYAHDAIQALPRGYDTELGPLSSSVPAGLLQRIALARALFGGPAIIVLDEPTNNLDEDGAAALLAALNAMKARGQTVILISRDPEIAGSAHAHLKLEGGRQRSFATRDEPAADDPPGGKEPRAARR